MAHFRAFDKAPPFRTAPPDPGLLQNLERHEHCLTLSVYRFLTTRLLPLAMKPADSDSKPNSNRSDSRITLEAIISVGVFGWLAIGMVLMGLGIW